MPPKKIEHSLNDVNAKILINYDEYARLKNLESKSTSTPIIDQSGKGLLSSPVPSDVVPVLPSESFIRKPIGAPEISALAVPDIPIRTIRKIKSKKTKRTKKRYDQLGGGDSPTLEPTPAPTPSTSSFAAVSTTLEPTPSTSSLLRSPAETPTITESVSCTFIPRNFLYLD